MRPYPQSSATASLWTRGILWGLLLVFGLALAVAAGFGAGWFSRPLLSRAAPDGYLHREGFHAAYVHWKELDGKLNGVVEQVSNEYSNHTTTQMPFIGERIGNGLELAVAPYANCSCSPQQIIGFLADDQTLVLEWPNEPGNPDAYRRDTYHAASDADWQATLRAMTP